MTHWKKMMDPKEMLFAFDLDGRDVTLTIDKVVAGELIGEQGRKSKKPIASFKETPKRLALNTTNCKTIAQLYGSNDTAEWSGKLVTLFPSTTNFGGATVDCIRIRPQIPKAASKPRNGAAAPATSADEPADTKDGT